MARDIAFVDGYLPLYAGTEVVRRSGPLTQFPVGLLTGNLPALPAPPPIRAGMLAWWDFEENSAVGNQFADSTGNGSHLTTSPTTDLLSAASGKPGRKLSRGGEAGVYNSRMIYLPRSNKSLDRLPTQSVTMGLWYNPNRASDALWGRSLMGRDAGTNAPSGGTTGIGGKVNSSYLITAYNNNINFTIYRTLGDGTPTNVSMSAYPAVGTWVFLVAVYDYTLAQMRVYRNGTRLNTLNGITTGPRSGPTVNANFIFTQPMYNDSTADTDAAVRQTDGFIDSAFVSGDAMTDAQVLTMYNSGTGFNWSNFVAAGI